METALMEATGLNARLLLLKDVVRVQRVGWRNALSGASRTERDILISQIVSVQFRKAGLLSNGYIGLVLMHYDESHKDDSGRDTDDVFVSFRPGQEKAFEAFREMLEAKMTRVPAGKATTPAASDLDQLEKLASLRDRGIITEEEFNLKKKQLLGL
ncbi:MAG: SHOCT domain-containing protein [Dehalococcoidia bacterium]|nr:SHOCT domain-containing protein [Dehalococcoidia bacterium]